MYKRTKLTMDEIDEIRANLVIKGVTTRRLNPKGMTIDELFGTFNKESHEWHEGLFTQHYRDFSSMKGDKKKWILLDGPIDYMWVENLNSMLDDNKRMSLPNGESIKMSDGMCILLETNNLKNVTPATVSRCGLIYLHRRETCSPKAIFNKWLRNLPPNLAEYAKDLECSANFLMVEPIAVFLEDEKAGRIRYKGIDLHWVMQNFIRIL
jgi:dynein heavy chain